jgi:hypothetical protein
MIMNGWLGYCLAQTAPDKIGIESEQVTDTVEVEDPVVAVMADPRLRLSVSLLAAAIFRVLILSVDVNRVFQNRAQ